MNSIWSETAKAEEFKTLESDAKTDVLIIGGGMAGILCAYFLQNAGVNYILVEGNKIGSGVTKNTTAKITSQHGLLYHKLLKEAGAEKAKIYLTANEAALKEYKKLCSKIDCDFEEKNSYIYSKKNITTIEKELNALQKIGFKADFSNKASLPFKIAGAVKFPKQAQFHPLKFLSGISKGLNIFENTYIKELTPNKAFTDKGRIITANHIIIASHFPFLNKHGSYFLKMYQHRSYAIAVENAANVNGMYLEDTPDGMSFRNYGDTLIIGGGGHKTGKNGGNWKVLQAFAKNAYQNSLEKYAWATQDCMTLDGVPYIGHYGKSSKGLYVATGFNKWGMTSSMVSAMILTDMILNRKNDYASVFSPQRSIIKPQLALNAFSAVGNLLTPTPRRCPHMGCALKWNSIEHSWDCPCHGSRFDKNGYLLDNPATGRIKL